MTQNVSAVLQRALNQKTEMHIMQISIINLHEDFDPPAGFNHIAPGHATAL